MPPLHPPIATMSTEAALEQALDAMLQRGIEDLKALRQDNHSLFFDGTRQLGELRGAVGTKSHVVRRAIAISDEEPESKSKRAKTATTSARTPPTKSSPAAKAAATTAKTSPQSHRLPPNLRPLRPRRALQRLRLHLQSRLLELVTPDGRTSRRRSRRDAIWEVASLVTMTLATLTRVRAMMSEKAKSAVVGAVHAGVRHIVGWFIRSRVCIKSVAHHKMAEL